jgi:tetratricopeptide (TPR) repeat protein
MLYDKGNIKQDGSANLDLSQNLLTAPITHNVREFLASGDKEGAIKEAQAWLNRFENYPEMSPGRMKALGNLMHTASLTGLLNSIDKQQVNDAENILSKVTLHSESSAYLLATLVEHYSLSSISQPIFNRDLVIKAFEKLEKLDATRIYGTALSSEFHAFRCEVTLNSCSSLYRYTSIDERAFDKRMLNYLVRCGFEGLIEVNPSRAHTLKALFDLSAGNYDLALEHASSAISTNSDLIDMIAASEIEALVYKETGDIAKAETLFIDLAAKIKRSMPSENGPLTEVLERCNVNLADIYIQQGKEELAEKLLAPDRIPKAQGRSRTRAEILLHSIAKTDGRFNN